LKDKFKQVKSVLKKRCTHPGIKKLNTTSASDSFQKIRSVFQATSNKSSPTVKV
jgi:hypothetical protein